MDKKYDTLVFICRAQPVHNAHIETIHRAARMAKQVVVVLGSANQPRTFKNPFLASERAFMIQHSLQGLDKLASVHIEFNTDSIYNDPAWAGRVQTLVRKHTYGIGTVGIIGHDKDESTYYLKMFPQWVHEDVELIEPLHATSVRDMYFRRDFNPNFLRGVVPPAALDFMEMFSHSAEYEQILREREFLIEHNKQYAGLKYPPIFVTADAVVVQSGHVLMVKRRAEPGKGLWAFPGGYVNAKTDKSVTAAMLRELREETGIKVPEPVLRGSITDTKVFDAVDRSPRGRIITHAYKIVLPDGPLPKVKGADDAEKAVFREFAAISSDECFEDHYEMLQWALGV